MSEEVREQRLSVRLEGADVDALESLLAYVRVRCGPGVRVEASDAVRFALHATVEAVVRRELEAEAN